MTGGYCEKTIGSKFKFKSFKIVNLTDRSIGTSYIILRVRPRSINVIFFFNKITY